MRPAGRPVLACSWPFLLPRCRIKFLRWSPSPSPRMSCCPHLHPSLGSVASAVLALPLSQLPHRRTFTSCCLAGHSAPLCQFPLLNAASFASYEPLSIFAPVVSLPQPRHCLLHYGRLRTTGVVLRFAPWPSASSLIAPTPAPLPKRIAPLRLLAPVAASAIPERA